MPPWAKRENPAIGSSAAAKGTTLAPAYLPVTAAVSSSSSRAGRSRGKKGGKGGKGTLSNESSFGGSAEAEGTEGRSFEERVGVGLLACVLCT